jgi:hypothetical protein
MAYGGGATAAAAAAAAAANAIKAAGAIVKMKPDQFIKILAKIEAPLLVHATGGFFKKNHQYLVNYKGLFFFTKTKDRLMLPGSAEVVEAGSIWIP